MSCQCTAEAKSATDLACCCDNFSFPGKLRIDAGLPSLPRQVAGFAEYRRALLHGVASKDPLSAWRASGKEDLGIMLLEMWSYVADVISFYDEVIAQENYLRTAVQRPSLRKLVALLGYLPTPALGSRVQLAAFATGRLPVTIPAGTAIQSDGAGGNPPQIFETDNDIDIHPFNNKWAIAPQQNGKIPTDNPAFLLIILKAEIKPSALLVLLDYDHPDNIQILRVQKTLPYKTASGKTLTKIFFKQTLQLTAGTPMDRLWLMIPEPGSTMYKLAASQEANDALGFQQVLSTETYQGRYLTRAVFSTDYVELALSLSVPTAGMVTDEASATISASAEIFLSKRAEKPPDEFMTSSFSLFDVNSRGKLLKGNLNFESGLFTPGQGESWSPDLVSPVDLYGNLIAASRGQSVFNEILGDGDATVASQQFKLQKNPLTYFLSGTQGAFRPVSNTLEIHVDGIRWKEVPGFFNIGPAEEVYIVRQNDNQESLIIFGDGIRARRLPSGTGNIVADYRFGAGAGDPPADSITQLQHEVPGLSGATNPVAAGGGADFENENLLRTNAPKSALILGRAVSMDDIEALALSVPGIQAAQSEWWWHPRFQTAVVHVWYVGETGIEALLIQQLNALTDPTVVIAAQMATAVPSSLQIDCTVDPRYETKTVISAVLDKLSNSDAGMLAPEHIGIGSPLFRSRLFKEILSVEGVVSVNNMIWNNQHFSAFAYSPGAGRYFQFAKGSLIINGIS